MQSNSLGLEYQTKIATAEAAVSEMTDPALKQVAFGKILERLLAEANEGGPTQGARRSVSSTNEKTKGNEKAERKAGPVAYIEELVDEAFFAQPKSLLEVRVELSNRGHTLPSTSLSGPLQALCQRRRLRRTKQITDGKEVFVYSNW